VHVGLLISVRITARTTGLRPTQATQAVGLRPVVLIGDSRDQECRAFFEKPSRDGIRVGLLVGAVE